MGTGIASIWARDPVSMANAGRTVEDGFPGRFVMGLGVSHPFLTTPRERTYERPLERMRAYLEAMNDAPYAGPPAEQPPRVLAALGPKMLQLARDRTHGAHPYFVPVEHTELARTVLGREPVLAPEQAVLVSSDGAREPARTTFLVMKEGRLIFEGDQDELEASKDPYISKFCRQRV